VKTPHAGEVLVELQDESGQPIPGHTFAEADPLVGDSLDRPVTWQGNADIGAHAGKPVSLSFRLRRAQLFAFEFGP
jgi:hypothetical protein